MAVFLWNWFPKCMALLFSLLLLRTTLSVDMAACSIKEDIHPMQHMAPQEAGTSQK